MKHAGLPEKVKTILLVQFKPVGDVLLTSPVAEYIKKNKPGIRVVFLVNKNFVPVIENNPFIDDILILEHNSKRTLPSLLRYLKERVRLIRRLRDMDIDMALDYIGLPSSVWLILLSGIKYRLGYGDLRGRKNFYNIKAVRKFKGRYTVLNKYNLIDAAGLLSAEPVIDTNFFLSETDRKYADDYYDDINQRGRVVMLISPSSPRPVKKWYLEGYRELTNMVLEYYGGGVVVLSGPGEEQYCRDLVSALDKRVHLLPDTTLPQAAAVIERCSFAVFNCGGMKHISVAVKTPSVTLFGPTDPAVWHPGHLPWAIAVRGDYSLNDQSFGVKPGLVFDKIMELEEKGFIKPVI